MVDPLKNCKHIVVIVTILRIINSSLLVGVVLFTGLLMEYAYLGELFGISFSLVNVFLILAFYSILLISTYIISEYVLMKLMITIKFSLEKKLIHSIPHKHYESSEVINILNSDIKLICDKHYKSKILIVKNITFIACVLAFSLHYHYWSFIVTSAFIAVACCLQFFFVRKISEIRHQVQNMKITCNRYIQSFVSARLSIKSFGGSNYIRQRMDAIIKQKADKEKIYNSKILITDGFVSLVPTVATIFCGIFYAFIIRNTSLDFSGAITMIFITGFTLWEVVNMFRNKTQMDSAKKILQKFNDTMYDVKDVKDVKDAKPQPKDSLKNHMTSFLEFVDVSVKFEDHYAIKDLSLALHEGRKYLVIGDSGSGKSTFLSLILKDISEYKGNIFYKQEDLKTVDKDTLWGNIAYLPQEGEFIPENVALNIAFNEHFDDANIKDALESAEFPQAITQQDKTLTEDQSNFSGGELQKLALARVFYHAHTKELLLLDECTSAIDKKARGILMRALTRLDNKTVIAISHNADEEDIKTFDEVILFRSGKVSFCGKYEEDNKIIHEYISMQER